MRQIALILFGLLVVAYPFAVYFGLQVLSLRQLALVLFAIFVIRLFLLAKGSEMQQASSSTLFTKVTGYGGALVGVGLLLVVVVSNEAVLLRFYPVCMNLLMLLLFVWTLLNPPSAIERVARRFDPNLSELGVRHTRQVTQVWCLFFIINGAVAGYTALYASMDTWTLYNGFIAYLLMGLLFAGELLVRYIRKQRAGE